MNDFMKEYERWLQNADEETVKELQALKGNEEEIAYRFKSGLSFGTAGLRGIMMAGLNAMNVYTVARATMGLADYIRDLKAEDRGVIIGCDSRLNAEAFSKKAACVLAAYGIKLYLYSVRCYHLRKLPCFSSFFFSKKMGRNDNRLSYS